MDKQFKLYMGNELSYVSDVSYFCLLVFLSYFIHKE